MIRKQESKKAKKQKGQVMLESIIAITMVTIGLLGIITLLIRSSRQNQNVAFQLQATYLAAEGIEAVKNIIDTSIAEELEAGGTTWNAEVPTLVPGAGNFYEIEQDGSLTSRRNARRLRFASSTGFFGYDFGNETFFEREVEVYDVSGQPGERILVRSTVSWGRSAEQEVALEDVFTYWRRPGGK